MSSPSVTPVPSPDPAPDPAFRPPRRGSAPQADFARAILDPRRPAPAGLVGPDGKPSEKRFAVYRNNVIIGLIETLKAAFPVVHRLVGNEFFAAMAGLHALAEPPSSPIMLDYGAGFPAFVASFGPAAVLPYLADVARLERTWAEAYHAAEAPALPPSDLGRVPACDVPALRLRLHPSVRLVRSAFPIVQIWRENVARGDVAAIDPDAGGEDALVARPEAEVEVRVLPEGAAAFIAALGAGIPIVAAAGAGLDASPRFDIAGALRGMTEAGIITGYCAADHPMETAR